MRTHSTHTHAHAHAHAHTHTSARTHTHAHTHTRTHTCIQAQTRTCAHTRTVAHTHTRTHTYSNIAPHHTLPSLLPPPPRLPVCSFWERCSHPAHHCLGRARHDCPANRLRARPRPPACCAGAWWAAAPRDLPAPHLLHALLTSLGLTSRAAPVWHGGAGQGAVLDYSIHRCGTVGGEEVAGGWDGGGRGSRPGDVAGGVMSVVEGAGPGGGMRW